MVPTVGAIEAFLVIFYNLPQPIRAFITLSLFLFVVFVVVGIVRSR